MVEAPVLVVGATGQQGGATARELLAAGVPVRALVRDPATARAKAVEALGAELVVGDLRDRDGLARAVKGVRSVFSVQMPDMSGPEPDFAGEVAQAVNLLEAAKNADVPQFVHTSVSGAGLPGRIDERWAFLTPGMEAKATIQGRLRAADFPRWTLLKPGFFMENFLPSAHYLFPRGIEGGLVTILRPETRLSLAAVRDIGRAAAAAIAEPDRFDRVELELASDYRSMAEIAPVLSRVLGVPLAVPDMTVDEAVAAGMPPMGLSHKMLNALGQPARPEFAREFGIPLTSFEEWAETTMRA
ncbi:NmrA family NAD(P)-binding protein [Amycolatopsis orientalis]|uniref:NmrA family NAD(P)-binding protein n=1 Tax=Amycolatopsis orientalis TaxID=31958 RepID=UPI0003A84F03|nr:NmrA family NAD(P)-binding protein [Amycolatopsis orientalis]